MSIRSHLICLFMLLSHLVWGQRVEWAHRIVDFSSEASPVEFSAEQVLGEPDVLPATEKSPNSWSPGLAKKEHFVTVAFKTPLKIRQTAIAEAYNPGAIKEVYAYDPDQNSHLLYSLEPKISEQQGRMFNFFLNETPFEVNQLKIVFDGQMHKGDFYIDAVGISDSDVPIRATVNQNPLMRKELIVQSLGSNINSSDSEIRPLLSPDGKSLFFSRKNSEANLGGVNDEEDIWKSTYNDETESWGPAENLGAPLNNKGKNYINAISGFGEMTLIILGNEYSKGDKMKSGMSVSNTTPDGWSKPVPMDFSNDPRLIGDFDFTLSHNRKQIIFAVEKEDTHGGKDLYVSFLQRTTVWTEPINLGSIINSVGEEASPFLATDGKTLYFSSKGRSGFGGSDIYVSQRLDNTWKNWSEPQNMGPEINSVLDEKYFNIPPKGDKAFFSRYISPTNADVFSVSLPLYETPRLITIRASIKDDLTGDPVTSKVTLGESVMSGNSFQVDMEAGKIYRCRIEANGYLLHDEVLDLTNNDISETLEVEIALRKSDETLTFDNIVFASNQAMLLERSFTSLDEVAKILRDNPELELEIASHTDNIGTEEDNLSLSKLRAEAILVYLGNKGADPTRITLTWYGESKPVASNETEAGRKKNRRVEFKFKR